MFVNLIGDITQTEYPPDDRFTLFFKGIGGSDEGKYGCSCWWLPFGHTGIKVYNRKGGTKALANAQCCALSSTWSVFRGKVTHAKAYLPEVLDWIVIRHVGAYIRGGNIRTRGHNDGVFYPACLMRSYAMPKHVPDEVLADMKSSFRKDRISLHWDTFREAQIGKHVDGYVVLDFETGKEKYL